eukprot:CAMPEP_0174373552 /NCGR_PEP_ID=MMETSP0811_2-20130205/107570_1 /TAXON_ID=73025 ORGANISM="Eutreptiella gymnastica-like, Strain CCMP1594" /NCGR_SAMPLE_ID=MMETSP0811_2 /ASSEMBLY_ACC=CAM_ASM_000667 /LENGTH=105 /DNA_ID=CAMNT_0015522005 /DNA_START=281 /DNA_END=595 /DNA_ORIENTATION=+
MSVSFNAEGCRCHAPGAQCTLWESPRPHWRAGTPSEGTVGPPQTQPSRTDEPNEPAKEGYGQADAGGPRAKENKRRMRSLDSEERVQNNQLDPVIHPTAAMQSLG